MSQLNYLEKLLEGVGMKLASFRDLEITPGELCRKGSCLKMGISIL